jgi:cytochrome c-type biogenesis protein CcmH
MPSATSPFVFWSIAAAMTAIALAFVLPRLLARRRPRDDAARGAINVAIYRGQLAELDRDLAAGLLTDDQHRDARLDLERRLLAEADADDRAPGSTVPTARSAIALTLALPLAAFALYAVLGNPSAVRVDPAIAVGSDTAGDDPAVVREQLAQHLARNPGDARGWVLLGRHELERDRFGEAADAFGKAIAASNKVARDPSVWCDYADALGMAQGGRLAGKPRELVARALALDPAFPRALEMAGSAAYEQREFARAADYWRQLLAQLRQGTQPHAELAAAIARAERLEGAPAMPLASAGSSAIAPAAARGDAARPGNR